MSGYFDGRNGKWNSCRFTWQIFEESPESYLSPSRGTVWGYFGEPLFATPCCNTSRAAWSTPSEPSHKKPFFEVKSFSALFDPGCCCQLVCFEFGVLHFRLLLYTRNGQVGEHVLLLWFWDLVWLAADVNLSVLNFLCFISVYSYPKRETGRL